MKKIFLTSGLVICMACPAFATGDGISGTGNECVMDELGVDSGTANIEATWTALQYTVTYDKGQHAATGVSNFVDTDGATYDDNYVAKTGGGANAQASQTGIYAATGYTFQGWNTADNQTSSNWTGATPWKSTSDLTVYAAYSANTNQISYETGTAGSRTTGFSGTMADTDATYDSSVTLRTNAFTIPGYEFAGWSSDVNLASGATAASSYTNGQTINPYKVDADVTLTATWTPLHYTVVYNKGQHAATGVNNYQDSYNSQTQQGGATYDAAYAALAGGTAQSATGIYAAPGYTFQGWNTADNQTASNWTGETPWTHTDALTVYAAYTANSYTITYNCGSPKSGSQSSPQGPTTESASVTMDQGYTLAAADNCTMDGYTFAGWDCKTGGQNPVALTGTPGVAYTAYDNTQSTIFAAGATGTFSNAADVTCTAKWTPNTIGLTWTADDENVIFTAPQNDSCSYDGSITLPTEPTRTGYTFGGWSVAAPAAPAAPAANSEPTE